MIVDDDFIHDQLLFRENLLSSGVNWYYSRILDENYNDVTEGIEVEKVIFKFEDPNFDFEEYKEYHYGKKSQLEKNYEIV